MQTLEVKIQSLFPDLSLFVIEVSQDILENPSQYPEITTSTEKQLTAQKAKAPSGWSLPNSHYQQKINAILKQSKDARYLFIIQKYLESQYIARKTNETFIEIYNLLRQGNLPSAVSSLTSSNLQLHAAMLTGYQTLLGHNSLELDIKEWILQAKNFSLNKKYPLLERAVFGVISGNPQPIREWLGPSKSDTDEAWICCISGIRESLCGGSGRSYLAQTIQLLSKSKFDGQKLISGDYTNYISQIIVEFTKLNEIYDENALIQQRKIALIASHILSTINQIPLKTQLTINLQSQLNNLIETYVRQILNQQNPADSELIPYFIFNLDNFTSIQLILIYLKQTRNYQLAIQLAEESLQNDVDSILQFRFLAIQQLSEMYLNNQQLANLSQLAVFGRFPLSANISFIYLLFISRNLIINDFFEELKNVIQLLIGLLDSFKNSISEVLIEEFNIIMLFSRAINSDFVDKMRDGKDKQSILKTFSEMQNNYFTCLDLIKTGSFLIFSNQAEIVATEQIFNSQSHQREQSIQKLIEKVVSDSLVNISHSLFVYCTQQELQKRNQYLNNIIGLCDYISDESANFILLNVITKTSLAEILMVAEKAQIGLLCNQ
ncbi:hypothetical protein SS50377_23449 [Spironucleus salmonicida]|uniref:Uncharacterized protein n=1 Tax=Spironucleus salmonicida TaxID=348837 RepID=V6LR75_9EUKA|nr:hypothetical protein SS50377_23449 [Spironucleus salmonicida]|eukprot:EST46186.1 hypothetical protein SS50377_13781 [Spironucleus salmonicida]